jgi:hypothetical protein
MTGLSSRWRPADSRTTTINMPNYSRLPPRLLHRLWRLDPLRTTRHCSSSSFGPAAAPSEGEGGVPTTLEGVLQRMRDARSRSWPGSTPYGEV